jgi:putative addiction module component (TIGR02574 family)
MALIAAARVSLVVTLARAVEWSMGVDVARTIDDLQSLSVDDRVRIVQAVWDSLPEQAALPTAPERAAELNRRLDAYEADPEDLLTWDEVLERLRGRL